MCNRPRAGGWLGTVVAVLVAVSMAGCDDANLDPEGDATVRVSVTIDRAAADGIRIIVRNARTGEDSHEGTTGPGGAVLFEDVEPGRYTLIPVVPTFWVSSSDGSGGSDLEVTAAGGHEVRFDFRTG